MGKNRYGGNLGFQGKNNFEPDRRPREYHYRAIDRYFSSEIISPPTISGHLQFVPGSYDIYMSPKE